MRIVERHKIFCIFVETKTHTTMEPTKDILHVIKDRLPNAPIHEIATYIVKYAPDEAKNKMTAAALLNLLTFKQIHTKREEQCVIKVVTGFIAWNSELAELIMHELLNRLVEFSSRT